MVGLVFEIGQHSWQLPLNKYQMILPTMTLQIFFVWKVNSEKQSDTMT